MLSNKLNFNYHECQKYCMYEVKLIRLISQVIILVLVVPTQLLAQPSPMKISLEFPSGDSRGAPESTVGAGRRGVSCITLDEGKPSLTALMPKRDNKSRTVSETPELYFYVPKTVATTGEFILRLEDEDVLYTTFKLTGKPGIVKLQIPSTATLKPGSTYKWYFMIICNPSDRSADQYTEGIIERVDIDPSLNKALEQAAPLKQAEIYAKYDLWPETISRIAQLRTEKPDEWKELLKSVGLETIGEEKLLDCCQPNPEPK